jgi:hypothetical protein
MRLVKTPEDPIGNNSNWLRKVPFKMEALSEHEKRIRAERVQAAKLLLDQIGRPVLFFNGSLAGTLVEVDPVSGICIIKDRINRRRSYGAESLRKSKHRIA